MERTATLHRKLIDIKPSVFESLSQEASRQGVSLKRFIEDLLERSCPRREVPESGISRLIGSALPKSGDLVSINDDRLKYLLSK
ncbi:MAG: hypothetical protein J6T02_04175 [Bacteroidales bacterium]|nr:hypothetical protein [Bacteroidales bacterium]